MLLVDSRRRGRRDRADEGIGGCGVEEVGVPPFAELVGRVGEWDVAEVARVERVMDPLSGGGEGG